MTTSYAGSDSNSTPAALRALGLALCKPDPGTKSPTYAGWGTRSLEPDDFGPGDLYGILGGPLSDCNRPGHALIPIDLDDAAVLEAADRFLPATGMEEGKPEKPRDHRYVLTPVDTIPPWAVSAAEQAAPAALEATGHAGPAKKAFNHLRTKKRLIDFIGTGGQVVCPSPGNRREWVGGKPGEPAVVPFLDLWRAVERLAVACGGGDLLKRVLAYLDRCDPAVSGKNGHSDTLWPARAVCYGFDLGEAAGFHVLRDHFNRRCQPPWSDEELRHKCHDADTLPFGKARGWLLDAPAEAHRGNGKPADAEPAGDGKRLGVDIIHAHFQERYRPVFKDGSSVHCKDGSEVTQTVACSVPDSELIQRLAAAVDAPRDEQGVVRRARLPGFFRNWVKVAWGDLLRDLPDEDTAELGDDAPACEEFRRLVREAMLSEVVLGDVIGRAGVLQTERRSLIGWCDKFAKPGPWRSIRSKLCWCRLKDLGDGEAKLQVAVRHELFSQLHADRRLSAMGVNTFNRRAKRYKVGASKDKERPHGQRAIVLDADFVADLIATLPEDDDGTAESPEG